MAYIQNGTIVFQECEAEYWACESFCDDERFFEIPVPDFELEDYGLGGGFNVTVCDLEFERGWFQFFDYVLGGHLEDFVVIGFGDAVDQCSGVDEGVQGQVLEVHWGE